MSNLVGTCPKDFWAEWLAEGDAAGEPPTGQEYGWYTGHSLAIAEPIPDFRGLRLRWWSRDAEVEFPDWRTP